MYYDAIIYEFEFSSGVWTDVSSHVIGSDRGKMGLMDWGPLDRVASTGTFSFSLHNLNNRYTPGHIDCTSGFDAGVRFRLRLEYESRTVTRFYGIVPADGIDLDSSAWFGATEVTVVDFMEQMSLHEMDLPEFAEDKRLDEVIPLILYNLPVKPLNTELYAGQDTFATVFDTTKATTRAIQEAAKAALSELGYIYIRNRLDGDADWGGTIEVSGAGTTGVNGTYYYYGIYNSRSVYIKTGYFIGWSGTAWVITDDTLTDDYYSSTDDVATPDLCTTWSVGADGAASAPSVDAGDDEDEVLVVEGRYTKAGAALSKVNVWNGATYDEEDAIFDNITLDEPLSRGKHYYNHVKTITYPRRVDSSAVVLFELNRYIEIDAGATVKMTGRYIDPDQEAVSVSGIEMVTPVATTDYLMNTASDGGGSNITADLDVVATYGANGVEYELTNNNAAMGYVTHLQARGKGVYTYRPVEYEKRDDASILIDGKRTLNLNMNYQDNPMVGEGFADNLLDLYMEKRLVVESITFVANASQFLMNAFMDLQVGDKIEVVKDSAGIDAEYFIQSINFTIAPGGIVHVTYGLRIASTSPTESYWFIGEAGTSEIGETTWIGF